jgi:hypothetical protein
MTGVLIRFYEENRRLLTLVAAVLLGNVVVYLLLTAPAKLRERSLGGDLAAAREAADKALGEYGRALLETRLYESAESRIAGLASDVLQSRRHRFAAVDSKFKEIAAKFRLEANSFNYGYADLPPERLERHSVSFNLKGSYENLRRFVTEIEQAKDADGRDMFFAIDQVQLDDSTEAGAELNLTIGVATYYHKPELAEADKAKVGRR